MKLTYLYISFFAIYVVHIYNVYRHFTFCEISFFSRWYKEQSKETREAVKKLVSTEQIQFVNGGWGKLPLTFY